MIPMTNTVGIDLDSHDGYTFTGTYLNASRLGTVLAERTRRGFHIHITLSRPMRLDRVLDVRRALGDCAGRLEYDEFRLRVGDYDSFGTLFTWKRGVDVEEFTVRLG